MFRGFYLAGDAHKKYRNRTLFTIKNNLLRLNIFIKYVKVNKSEITIKMVLIRNNKGCSECPLDVRRRRILISGRWRNASVHGQLEEMTQANADSQHFC